MAWHVTVAYYRRAISFQKIERSCEEWNCEATYEILDLATIVTYFFKAKGPARMFYLETLAKSEYEYHGIADVDPPKNYDE